VKHAAIYEQSKRQLNATYFVAKRRQPSGFVKEIPNEILGGLRRPANKNC
jgi:hypothetical protein